MAWEAIPQYTGARTYMTGLSMYGLDINTKLTRYKTANKTRSRLNSEEELKYFFSSCRLRGKSDVGPFFKNYNFIQVGS